MSLATHTSGKAQVLEQLFPGGAWKELLLAIVWEVIERVPPGTTFRFKRWIFNIDITIEEFASVVNVILGPKP